MALIDVKPNQQYRNDRQNKLVVLSFQLMRKYVGFIGLSIGILLPIITVIINQCFAIQESISHYYYTIAGDVFVGLLCAVAFFLIMYPGNGRLEDIWTNIAGCCAICVAIFPTGYHQLDTSCAAKSFCYAPWVSTVHLLSAAAFFIILGGVAIFQFPEHSTPTMNIKGRKKRNKFYQICGFIMWLCIIILAPMVMFKSYAYFLSANKIVFIVEVIALVAFGLCWLIKGKEMVE